DVCSSDLPRKWRQKGASLLIPVNLAGEPGNTAQSEDVTMAVDYRIWVNTKVLSGFAHWHRDSGDGGALVNNNGNTSPAAPYRDGGGAGKRAMSDVCEYFLEGVGSCEGEISRPVASERQLG